MFKMYLVLAVSSRSKNLLVQQSLPVNVVGDEQHANIPVIVSVHKSTE